MQELLEDRLERAAQGVFRKCSSPLFDLLEKVVDKLQPEPPKHYNLEALQRLEISGWRMVPGEFDADGKPHCVYTFYHQVQVGTVYRDRLEVREDYQQRLSREGQEQVENDLRIIWNFKE